MLRRTKSGGSVIRLGVAGLGRAFTLMLPTLLQDPRVRIVAVTDARHDSAATIANELGARVHADVDALCADAAVDAVYVATPHQYHCAHACIAARHGKHVLVEKPMALSVDECTTMIAAAEQAGVHLVIGHSHSFDAPVAHARALIEAGRIGAVTMINAQYYTDFLYRLRRPEELSTADGGGVVYSQAAHQVDIVRLLGGGEVTSVHALTGAWDSTRPTEGAYAALLTFASGAFASLLYSGYGHFDGDALCGDVSELGVAKATSSHGAARRALHAVAAAAAAGGIAESTAKSVRNDATFAAVARAAADSGVGLQHEHFGMVIVSGERADLRLLPSGVAVYDDVAITFDAVAPPGVPRVEVIDELHQAIVHGIAPLHDGRWARATLEVCAALLRSARERSTVLLRYQTRVPPLVPHAQAR